MIKYFLSVILIAFYSLPSSGQAEKVITILQTDTAYIIPNLSPDTAYDFEYYAPAIHPEICKILGEDNCANSIGIILKGKNIAIYQVGCFKCTHNRFSYFVFVYPKRVVLITDYTNYKIHKKALNKLLKEEHNLTSKMKKTIRQKIAVLVHRNQRSEERKSQKPL